MRRSAQVLIAVLALSACKRNGRCCDTPDCSGGSDKVVGSDVLQFRGRVPTNLLFVSIDTWRKDHLAKDTTPFLNRRANEGLVLDNHQQCSNWTLGSMTCTLAGAFDTDRGHLTRLKGTDKNRPPIPQGTPFLATWLGDSGYRTAGVTSNKFFSDKWGNDQGYEKFTNPPGEGKRTGPKGLSFLRKLLKKDEDAPWFLHLHYSEPHAPYEAKDKYLKGLDDLEPWPENLAKKEMHYQSRAEWKDMSVGDQELLEDHLRIRYAGGVRNTDEIVADMWTDYDEKCWMDDTLVVVWNDHGEAFWEHGAQTHAYNLTGEENDGIAFFWSKNIVPGRYDLPTSAVDLAPTLLDLYGLEIPDAITGLPIGSADPERGILAGTIARFGAIQSITKNGYKLQYHWEDGGMRLWDRVADPDETENIYNARKSVAHELWAELEPEVQRMADLVINGSPEPVWPDVTP